METKETESKKVEETEAVMLPVSEAIALKDLSSDAIGQVITKKKHRLFDRSKKPEDYTLEELDIARQQKIEEEKLQRQKEEDEATLAMMRAEKKSYYEAFRQKFRMKEPYEVRLKAFFQYYTEQIHSPTGLNNKNAMVQIHSWMELYGVDKFADKKHVFTDLEFEAFSDRCKAAGIVCPFSLFIKQALEGSRINKETAVADQHRIELYKQV